MNRVQGTLREWVARNEVRRFIAEEFWEFLTTFEKLETHQLEYLR